MATLQGSQDGQAFSDGRLEGIEIFLAIARASHELVSRHFAPCHIRKCCVFNERRAEQPARATLRLHSRRNVAAPRLHRSCTHAEARLILR